MVDTTFIRARALSLATPTGRVLQEGLNFDVSGGQMLLVTGSNGCGKSTLLKTLLGQWPVHKGTLQLRASDTEIAYLPQLENTEIHLPFTLNDVLNISRPAKVSWTDVEKFGLLRRETLSAAWNTASGGERKRALLTRALLRSPSVLVFDEPMNHLDAESRRAMIRFMASFLGDSEKQRAIVMVSHMGLDGDELDLFNLVPLNLGLRKSGDI